MRQKPFIPEAYSKLFWDVDWMRLDRNKNRTFIIERILNMGDRYSLRWLRSNYAEQDILNTVKSSRRLSKKTARAWQNYYGLREDEMRCFSTYSMNPDRFY